MKTKSTILATLCWLFPLASALAASPQGTIPLDNAGRGEPGARSGPSTAPTVDSAAILVLDHMSDMIGSLSSVSYSLSVTHDVQDPDYGTIARFATHQVYMTGPDRMHVNSLSDKGHRGYWYNGNQVLYYSFTENNYGVMDAPGGTMAAIDDIHRRYGLDFPAADFFYPTFTDDLIAQSARIDYLGIVKLGGRECFRIVARGTNQTVQLWIANDATFLPAKFIITDHARANAQYQATFADWAMNPDLPTELYNFRPPPGASLIRILPSATTPEPVR